MPLAPTRAWRRRKKNQVWGRVIGGGCYGGNTTWQWKNGAKALVFRKKKKRKRKPRVSWFMYKKCQVSEGEWQSEGR